MAETLIADEQATIFDNQGFVLGGQLLTPKEADELNDTIDDIVHRPGNPYHKRVYDFKHGGRPLLHIKNMWKRYEVFRKLHEKPRLLDALYKLTGHRRFHLWQDRFFYKPAASGGLHPWHQDVVYLPFLKPFRAVSAWIALTDAEEANGAMRMVVGSHAWGDASALLEGLGEVVDDRMELPERFNGNDVKVVHCAVPKGCVHFHDARTWHASGPNWSNRPRNAIGLFFVDADVRFDGQNRWAGDYEGEHGQRLDPSHYPLVEVGGVGWRDGRERPTAPAEEGSRT